MWRAPAHELSGCFCGLSHVYERNRCVEPCACRHLADHRSGEYNIPVTPHAIINTTIPANITEVFSSATSGRGTTLSGPFDIQFRTWSVTVDNSHGEIDGGRPYASGEYRSLGSLMLRNDIVPIEGVIADMTAGGVGFRNHSVPVGLPYGGTWQEDLTWIEPVTECVDSNLTFHFSMGDSPDNLTNIFLVDNGGFANLEPEYPYPGLWNDTQNPDLRARAYMGAWVSNVLTAIFLNVTYPGRGKMDSFLGKQFNLGADLIGYHPDMYAIGLSYIDGGYLNMGLTSNTTGLNLTAPAQARMSITWQNFTDDAGIVCRGWGVGDYANITNVGIRCGYLYSAPRRVDGVESLIFEPQTNYTQNLYVCATGLRASVKTVGFSVNGTSSLDQLKVISVADKTYADNASMPLWAVEKSNLTIGVFSPLWGMVDDRYENADGVWTLRAKQFWLPAGKDLSVYISADSLAAPKVFQAALYSTYTESMGESSKTTGIADYSGKTNLALYKLWTQLSQTPAAASKIINLIFTEIAATATVGTKQVATDGSSSSVPPVTQYTKKIKYNMLYGIPAVIILAVVAIVVSAALLMWLLSRFSLAMMRQLLNQTATGRVATNLLYPSLCDPAAETKQWVAEAGQAKLSFALVEQSTAHPLMPVRRAPTLTFPRVGTTKAPLYTLIRESSNEKDTQ